MGRYSGAFLRKFQKKILIEGTGPKKAQFFNVLE